MVGPVRTIHAVALGQYGHCANGTNFLADTGVRGSMNKPQLVEFQEFFLEAPNQHHLAVPLDQLVGVGLFPIRHRYFELDPVDGGG